MLIKNAPLVIERQCRLQMLTISGRQSVYSRFHRDRLPLLGSACAAAMGKEWIYAGLDVQIWTYWLTDRKNPLGQMSSCARHRLNLIGFMGWSWFQATPFSSSAW